ncbi:FAD-dependent oxidoreductase [Algoriphagus yeomjeoni]|uniref:FAD dependent oxidoreductase n=1 Tax=Algoriphagus yeomjeoni TaxID=291403 RepID=A0A327P3W3_9BACT|nr:FAD-dependent oxidoreductase [Algoriphagus yeomjeoni]RAI85572.1 FAD dependent oxidoreductase [Algoriphagus yeomjeoni]
MPKIRLIICFLILLFQSPTLFAQEFDLVIYGGTSAGVAAGIQASRMDKSVLLIVPGSRLGGLTTGGLGQTDIGNKQAIGGVSREFYQLIKEYYNQPQNWTWQKREEYKDGGQTTTAAGEDAMWTFEPSAALHVITQMLEKETISVVYEERLLRTAEGVKKSGGRIQSITMESGKTYAGKMFIDATYEGDLMASAGVSYTVGREGNKQYKETLNGVQANYYSPTLQNKVSRNAINHNFVPGVDPYREKGNPASGLLPYISEVGPGIDGAGDNKVQAYCFRMCLTDHPENRIPFAKPSGYDSLNYELLIRNYEMGETQVPWINSSMPNRKTDSNNRLGFSTDFIGQNYDYPEASYEEREKIVAAHRTYQQGLMWTLAYHPRMPEKIRREVSRWGTSKDEFEREDGWQSQLYIREARRMISDLVMTQHHAEGLEVVEDAVGLAAYGMDSHHIQRYVDANGFVQNEGNVEAHVSGPYPISYRSIIPKKVEAENLLVPVCVSASHIAFGSIRMEPVFMVLGQSAAIAASLAIDEAVAVQDLSYPKLKARLLEFKQRLE